MSQLHLTPWQRQRLRRQLVETPDARVLRRTLAVLEFDHGRPAADIARMLAVSRQSVYNWVAAYLQARDPSALHDQEGRGRYLAVDEDDEHLLHALLAACPQDLGYPHANWTAPLLRDALQAATGRGLSEDTIRRTLHRLDYVWKRPRYDLEPDPLREKKTPHPPADPGPAQAERRAFPGRDRPAAVPAVAGRVVAARGARPGVAERPQRPAGHLRGHEPADGDTAVCAAGEGAER